MERKSLTFNEMIANMCGAVEEMINKRVKERTLTTPEIQAMINAYGKCEKLIAREIEIAKLTNQKVSSKDFEHVWKANK